MVMQLFASIFLYALVGEVICQNELTGDEKLGILNFHNALRGSVDPTASNMQTMVWSDELAQIAQNYVNTCVNAHNADRSQQSDTFELVGENFSVLNLAGRNGLVDYNELVQLWHSDRFYYVYSTNSCVIDERVCSRYTQVVWAQTQSLGCGARRCTELAGISAVGNYVILVCNYGPAGDFPGQRPYLTASSSCSACPSNLPYCSNNLCTDVDPSTSIIIAEVTTNVTLPATSTDAEVIDSETGDRATAGAASATLNIFIFLATSFITLHYSITPM